MAKSSNDGSAVLPQILQRSLCAACRHCRTITSGKGSVFFLCGRSIASEDQDNTGRYSKYPPQPVLHCPGFHATGEDGRGGSR
ncbi:MAG: hypothetical protein AAFN70_03100 [Planctomycetota bacterium]